MTPAQDLKGREVRGWQSASIGCHWTRGGYTISTYQQGDSSGYETFKHKHGSIGRRQTFETAELLAERRRRS